MERKQSRSPEWGRKAILMGGIVAMPGIAGYVFTMIQAPEKAGLFEALVGGGPVAWISAALVVVGVGVWVAGNLALLRGMAEWEGRWDQWDE